MKLKQIYNVMLIESSLSRIWQHVKSNDTFAVISPYRGSNTPDENKKLMSKLKSDIRGLGLGFIEQKSGYTYTNPATGEDGTVDEMSLFIPKITYAQAKKLGIEYKQETIIFKDSERFVLIDPQKGSVELKFKMSDDNTTFDPSVLKYAFSQLVKANQNSAKKYAFNVDENFNVFELVPPTRTESYMALKSKQGLVKAKWVKIL